MNKILFMCIANSARSQMAQGLAVKIFADKALIQSAGSLPSRVHPIAIRVMEEIGIDIQRQFSKSVDDIDVKTVDTVITLCAEEVCPTWLSKAKHYHWPIEDPARGITQEDQISNFRKARDEIKAKIEQFKIELLES